MQKRNNSRQDSTSGGSSSGCSGSSGCSSSDSFIRVETIIEHNDDDKKKKHVFEDAVELFPQAAYYKAREERRRRDHSKERKQKKRRRNRMLLWLMIFVGVCSVLSVLLLLLRVTTDRFQQNNNNDIDNNSGKVSSLQTEETKQSPWEGWSPRLLDHQHRCKWCDCFALDRDNDKNQNNSCLNFCRQEDLGEPPSPPSVDEHHKWIPDVTMLRRMYLARRDRDGQPWPPPLLNFPEICEAIGPEGQGRHDRHKTLINKVPIRPVVPDDQGATPTLLCLVYTIHSSHATQIRAIRETWAGLCDGFLAFSTKSDPRIPAISIPHDGPEEYDNMWQKVRSIWRYVGKHYLEQFDFFFIGGDDLFVIPQNLRHFLAGRLSSTTVAGDSSINDRLSPAAEAYHFVGRRFRSDSYFYSGGAGYAISRGLLRKFYHEGLHHPDCHPDEHTSMEDVMIAECFQSAEVFGIDNHDELIIDTRDAQLRERFHPFSPGDHLDWRPSQVGEEEDWYEEYNREWGLKLKEECCAPDSVSFHYVDQPALMRHIHALIQICPPKNEI